MATNLATRINSLIHNQRFMAALKIVKCADEWISDRDYWIAYLTAKHYEEEGLFVDHDVNHSSSPRNMYFLALFSKPDGLEARVDLARLLFKQEEPDKAFEILEDGLKYNGNNLGLYKAFADAYHRYLDVGIGIEDSLLHKFSVYLKRGLALASDSETQYSLRLTLAEIDLQRDFHERAEKHAFKALRIATEAGFSALKANLILANVYFRQEDVVQGLKYARAASAQATSPEDRELCDEWLQNYIDGERFREVFGGLSIKPRQTSIDPKDNIEITSLLGTKGSEARSAYLGSKTIFSARVPVLNYAYLAFILTMMNKLTKLGAIECELNASNHGSLEGFEGTYYAYNKKYIQKGDDDSDEEEETDDSLIPITDEVTSRSDFKVLKIIDFYDKCKADRRFYNALLQHLTKREQGTLKVDNFNITGYVEDSGSSYTLDIFYDSREGKMHVSICDYTQQENQSQPSIDMLRIREGIAILSYLFDDDLLIINHLPDDIAARVNSLKLHHIAEFAGQYSKIRDANSILVEPRYKSEE
ncbi:TPA: hypothetical protein HA246_02890 [Candidatus Woesearchaeota archaeon]|nr:hypothetical protein [Candidatus Woesearchaeota archaeon]